MVVQLNNGKVYVVTDMEDVRELVDPELFEAIVELTGDKNDTYDYQISNLEDEIKGYDNECYSMRGAISEGLEMIERLINYIDNAKRLDRDKIINDLQCISGELEDCEGYY